MLLLLFALLAFVTFDHQADAITSSFTNTTSTAPSADTQFVAVTYVLTVSYDDPKVVLVPGSTSTQTDFIFGSTTLSTVGAVHTSQGTSLITQPFPSFAVTYSAVLGKGTSQLGYYNDYASGYKPNTVWVTLYGPTTWIKTVTFPDYGVTGFYTQNLPTVSTYSTVVPTASELFLEIPNISGASFADITGPTTFVATVTAAINNTVLTMEPSVTTTFFYTLRQGTIALHAPTGAVTLTGPTTYERVFTVAPGQAQIAFAASLSGDPHCSQSANFSGKSDFFVTYAQYLTTLTASQTLTTTVQAGLAPATTTGVKPWDVNFEYVNQTFVGPTTVSVTKIDHLIGRPQFEDGGGYGPPPGQVCAGACGFCQLYFSTVYVYYWPVESPNTACLSTASAAAIVSNLTSRGYAVRHRGLSGLSGDHSTLINDEYTFTSPSLYIAFPTIAAWDYCGMLGSAHTSVTLGFPPESISTAVLGQNVWDTASYYSFDFRDAHCPPTSLAGNHTISIIGQTGYNPIISPPAQITDIDPAWGAACIVADFQGNDPPFALTPAANLLPSTTAHHSIVTTPASPSSGISTLPVQSNHLSPTGISSQPQSAVDPQSSQPLFQTPNDPPQPSPSSQNPSNPANRPPLGSALEDPEALSNLQASSSTHHVPAAPDPGNSLGDPKSFPQASNGPTASDPNNPSEASYQPSNTASSPNPKNPPIDPYSNSPLSASNPKNTASGPQVGFQTLTPGGPPITYAGNIYSLPTYASSIIVNGISSNLPITNQATNTPPVLKVGSESYTANSASGFVLGMQTLTPGGVIGVSGTLYSLPSHGSYVVAGPSTIPLIPADNTVPAIITISGKTYTANPGSGFVIGGQTLTPDGAVTVDGTPYSLPSHGAYLVSGTSAVLIFPAATLALTIGGKTYTANFASAFVIESQTLAPGAAITVSGTPISLPITPSYAVVGSQTIRLGATTTPPPLILTFHGLAYTANPSSIFTIGAQTLTPGGVITISGTPISLPPSASYALVGTSTISLSPAITTPAVLTVGGKPYTANAGSGFVVGGYTLTPGGAITVSGSVVSLPAATGTSKGIGGIIVSAFGGTGTSAVEAFEGEAVRIRSGAWWGASVVSVVWVLWTLLL